MSTLTCPNCGANLETSQSVRIAEYHFGRLTKEGPGVLDPPGFAYVLEQPDVYTVTCGTCKRLVRTLPIPRP
jgi:transcription elongation factor Elf1